MQAPASPSTGDKLDLASLKGALLYIRVHEEKPNIETSFGLTNAIACDVTALDGDHKGTTWEDVLIFPRVLQSQLKPMIGTPDPTVLGRLGHGLAKPGKSAPWLLEAPTPADMETGRKYEEYAAKQAAALDEPF